MYHKKKQIYILSYCNPNANHEASHIGSFLCLKPPAAQCLVWFPNPLAAGSEKVEKRVLGASFSHLTFSKSDWDPVYPVPTPSMH